MQGRARQDRAGQVNTLPPPPFRFYYINSCHTLDNKGAKSGGCVCVWGGDYIAVSTHHEKGGGAADPYKDVYSYAVLFTSLLG